MDRREWRGDIFGVYAQKAAYRDDNGGYLSRLVDDYISDLTDLFLRGS
jgi:hypothetical protein